MYTANIYIFTLFPFGVPRDISDFCPPRILVTVQVSASNTSRPANHTPILYSTHLICFWHESCHANPILSLKYDSDILSIKTYQQLIFITSIQFTQLCSKKGRFFSLPTSTLGHSRRCVWQLGFVATCCCKAPGFAANAENLGSSMMGSYGSSNRWGHVLHVKALPTTPVTYV